MQGSWPVVQPRAYLSDLIVRAGGKAYEHFGGAGGAHLVVEFEERLSRQLLVAAEEGDAGSVHWALEQRADANCRLQGGSQATALHLAMKGGSTECVQLLLKAGALVDVMDSRRQLPIDAGIAACSKRAIVDLLKTSEALVDALDLSARRWIGALHVVLERTPNLPVRNSYTNRNTVTFATAALEDSKQILKLMAQDGAYRSEQTGLKKSKEFRRAMFVCVERKWNGGLLALLTGLDEGHKLDPDRVDPKSRRTAFEFATALYKPQMQDVDDVPEVCEILRACGANPSKGNPGFAEWALLLAAARNDMQGVTYWLRKADEVDWREPPPPQDLLGGMRCTPLMIAAMEGHDESVQVLVEAKAAPWLCDSGGRNAGALAKQRGHRRIGNILGGIAEGYIKQKVENLSSDYSKRQFLDSLMPPPWSAPSGWIEATEEVDPIPAEIFEDLQPAGDNFDVSAGEHNVNRVDSTILMFTVEKAVDLVTDLYSFQCDPYVIVRLEGRDPDDPDKYDEVKKEQTKVITNTHDPEWNEKFVLDQVEPETDLISVVVMDESTATDDPLLGRAEFILSKHGQMLKRGKKVRIERRLQLQPRKAISGTIHVSMQFKRVQGDDESDEEVVVSKTRSKVHRHQAGAN